MSTTHAGASIQFTSGWGHVVEGSIVAGGQVTIEYDTNRAQLRPTGNGTSDWGVQAFVKMSPSGIVVERPVTDPRPATVQIPPGTTEIEVWFKNWAGQDDSRVAWDSNFGKNYRFPVQA